MLCLLQRLKDVYVMSDLPLGCWPEQSWHCIVMFRVKDVPVETLVGLVCNSNIHIHRV